MCSGVVKYLLQDDSCSAVQAVPTSTVINTPPFYCLTSSGLKVSFGHGHPVTSGSPGIDYFVSSSLFETKRSVEAREARRLAGTASDVAAATAADDDGTSSSVASCVMTSANVDRPLSHGRSDACGEVLSHDARSEGSTDDTAWRGRGDGAQDFTEQLVLFDSLTASLPEMSAPPNAPHIEALEARTLSSGLLREDDHAYHCIQHSKKFHPDFDPVLRGVLLGDAAAKILLAEGSKVRFLKRSTADSLQGARICVQSGRRNRRAAAWLGMECIGFCSKEVHTRTK